MPGKLAAEPAAPRAATGLKAVPKPDPAAQNKAGIIPLFQQTSMLYTYVILVKLIAGV